MPDNPESPIPAWQPARGRRTKLTPSLVTELSTYLRSGQCMEIASQLCGVTSASVRSWTRKAEEIQERLGEEEPSTEEESLFLSFLAAVSNARAEAVARAIMHIRLAERTDWRAAAWYLERTRPDLYGSVQRHKHALDKLSDEELIAETRRLF
jgi:hypothetical protein